MGYDASGAGKFTFDMSKVTAEQIDEILEKNECGCDCETLDSWKPNSREIEPSARSSEYYISFPYEHYREDLWHDFLRSTNGLLAEGEIEFDGEDDTHWRFHYRNGKWYEDDGYIAYREGREI